MVMMTTPTTEQRMEVPEKLKREFDWFKVIFLLHLNVLSLLGIYLLPQAMIRTWLFGLVLIIFGILGVTAGAHRLWAHKSYTATKNLRIFLMICQTLVGQGTIYNWVLQHRIHHKYFGTNFDPFNPSKGFFYSQIVQFIQKPHEYQDQLEAEIDMSDIEQDKVVMFQKKYYWFLYIIIFVLLPMNAPAEYWGENLVVAGILIGWLRYYIVLNMAWLIHSATLIWGLKNDERYPCDTNWVFFVNKSYWVQYHYICPWDYLTSEYGKYGSDCTSTFIRICAVLGCVTNLKSVDTDVMKKAAYDAVTTKRPLADVLLDVEKEIVDKEYCLKPIGVFM